jgi:hypothetical protein
MTVFKSLNNEAKIPKQVAISTHSSIFYLTAKPPSACTLVAYLCTDAILTPVANIVDYAASSLSLHQKSSSSPTIAFIIIIIMAFGIKQKQIEKEEHEAFKKRYARVLWWWYARGVAGASMPLSHSQPLFLF